MATRGSYSRRKTEITRDEKRVRQRHSLVNALEMRAVTSRFLIEHHAEPVRSGFERRQQQPQVQSLTVKQKIIENLVMYEAVQKAKAKGLIRETVSNSDIRL
jgi:hypothetical protein